MSYIEDLTRVVISYEIYECKILFIVCPFKNGGWSGGAMALGKLPVPGRPTIWIIVGLVGWLFWV